MKTKNIFLQNLNNFSPVLSAFGYHQTKCEDSDLGTSKFRFQCVYMNKVLKLELYFIVSLWKDDSSSISVQMYTDPSDNTAFTLDNFLDLHNLKHKITDDCAANQDFAAFCAQFFKDLESLFNHELRDQISGKSFEDHSKIGEASWNAHMEMIYQSQKSQIKEYQSSRPFGDKISSLEEFNDCLTKLLGTLEQSHHTELVKSLRKAMELNPKGSGDFYVSIGSLLNQAKPTIQDELSLARIEALLTFISKP